MKESRTQKSMQTMITGLLRQFLTIILTMVSRTVFIKILGDELLGVNGLFTNILSLLALSELGIGTAITFYLYKPVVENDIFRINQLMQFYKKCYKIIGIFILVLGLSIIPFLDKIVNLNQEVSVNLYLIYVLYVFCIASTYLFWGYKQTIFFAYQEQYKVEIVSIIYVIVKCIAEILVLLLFKDYVLYLFIQIFTQILKDFVVAKRADIEYPYLNEPVQGMSKKQIKKFFVDIYQVAIFKIGSQLLNATDNIIISVLLGTVVVGYYSNYYMITSAILTVYNVIIRACTASVGNIMVKENSDKQYLIYKRLNFINFLLSAGFAIILSQALNPFMQIWLSKISKNYILSQSIVYIISINLYFDTSCQMLNTFRETSGNFSTGYMLQIIAGIVNIILSVILGKWIGLEGILLSTILCKFFITIVPFISGVAKNVFHISKYVFIKEYLKNFIFLILCSVLITIICSNIYFEGIFELVLKVIITTVVFILFVVLFYRKKSEFVYTKNLLINGYKGSNC